MQAGPSSRPPRGRGPPTPGPAGQGTARTRAPAAATPTRSSCRGPALACVARPQPSASSTTTPHAGPPSFNPQNTPNPLVLPSPSLDAPSAVRTQVDALAANHTPWPGHGIQTAYAFCRDTGSLELSTYFRPAGRDAPLRRSLYHEASV